MDAATEEPGREPPGGPRRVPHPVLVVMGAAGSGKSTVAALLADRLGWDLAEGDDLHPPANVAKMAAGHPLDDDDRRPWLVRVSAWLTAHTSAGVPGVISCSALKRSYRDVLRREHVVFVHLDGTREHLAQRLAGRRGHYMSASMLDSQLADLEPPGPDEQALIVGIDGTPEEVATDVLTRLGLGRGTSDALLCGRRTTEANAPPSSADDHSKRR